MPIRLALSTLALSDADLAGCLAAARDGGYAALDLWSDDLAAARHPADPGLTEPWLVRDALGDAGLAVACLRTPLVIGEPGDSAADLERRWVAHYAARAAAIGSRSLGVAPAALRRGQSMQSHLRLLADRAAACAAIAAAAGVALLIANDHQLAFAHHAWMLCNLADDDASSVAGGTALGIAWHPNPAESPAVALPMLNTHVGLVRLDDVEAPAARDIVHRLCGLGYDGDLALTPPAPAAERIPAAAAAVESWLEAIAAQRATADAAAAKAAAKLKPAPAAPLRAEPAAAAQA